MSAQEAYQILTNHIKQIIFQAKSHSAPIQVLGILETAGMHFDSLWFMGLDNEHWPPPSSPNPFIPIPIQMKLNMPHASAKRELYFSKTIMQRLLNSADTIIFSSPNQEGDKQLNPSQLIQAYNKKLQTLGNSLSDASEQYASFHEHYMETIVDNKGPHLTDNERITGGTNIFKLQAICPFKAYAHIRLDANPLETPIVGLSNKLRGQILHEALEYIWKKIKNHHNLLAMTPDEVDTLISTSITHVLKIPLHQTREETILLLEKKRLMKLLNNWLLIEKARPPFSVLSYEASRPIKIGSLSFQCRIDRIDECSNGKQIVIDYKSGYTNINDWFSDRPQEPQLPIYCVFGNKKPYDGLAFAQVRAGAMEFKSIQSGDELEKIDGVEDWSGLIASWKTTLEHLSHTFCQGVAEADPLISACNYCQLKSLCRVEECQK